MFQFTHPVRGATWRFQLANLDKRFNSRTPCGVRRVQLLMRRAFQSFQFTHPVRGATGTRAGAVASWLVSIHAPRAGCDLSTISMGLRAKCFNSRTPCGVRQPASPTPKRSSTFQFTHPVRGATPTECLHLSALISFNSRTPCGVRRHSRFSLIKILQFQFTHPVRGATF